MFTQKLPNNLLVKCKNEQFKLKKNNNLRLCNNHITASHTISCYSDVQDQTEESVLHFNVAAAIDKMFKSQIVKLRKDFNILLKNANSYKTAVNCLQKHNQEWLEAKPFESLPGPSKYELIKGYLPGGSFYKKSYIEFNEQLRSKYGDIFLIPGIFGKRNILFTFNPRDYQQVFRTEGIQPIRRGFDILHYHRKVLRKNVFKHAAGLVAEQGEGWALFRSTVNPVMMQAKNIKIYIPKMDKVAGEFVKRIKEIRSLETLEVPENFEDDINHFTMDAVGLVALDTDLGMIHNSQNNPLAKAIIDGLEEFFQLLYELDMEPSLWKIIPTPKFKKIIKRLDLMMELAQTHVREAVLRIQKDSLNKMDNEKSILERLIIIDPLIALIMAMDIFVAGVDTTTSALTGCLLGLAKNPVKQSKLRQELLKILPYKTSSLTPENMNNLPYLRACIKESFRLYPVATGNFRATGQDIVLSGYRIPCDTDVAMTAQLLLKDPKYYAQPTEFIPERWLRSSLNGPGADHQCPLNKNEPFVFLPFGFGPRTCIGKRIVDLELEVAVAKLIRNFNVKFDYPTEDMYKTHVINVPAKPLKFKFSDIDF